jgi:DNA modification methylase
VTALLLAGDARRLPLPDASVDLVVTSPPYWRQRDYTDAGSLLPGQIGAEDTPAEYLANLWAVTAEIARVLRPDGSAWINLGDKRSDRAGPEWAGSSDGLTGRNGRPARRSSTAWAPRGSLLLLPELFAAGCTGALAAIGGPDPGLRLVARRDQIWHKPNNSPESVQDRTADAHEYVWHLTTPGRYYSAIDEIREEYAPDTAKRYTYGYGPNAAHVDQIGKGYDHADGGPSEVNPLGKLPGSVWTIPTEPLRPPAGLGRHPAPFAISLARRIILGWSPNGRCRDCRTGRRPVTARNAVPPTRPTPWPLGGYRLTAGRPGIIGYVCDCTPWEPADPPAAATWAGDDPGTTGRTPAPTGTRHTAVDRPTQRRYRLDQWTPAPTEPAIVLDPFTGSGTAPLVASALGRTGIGMDLSADYLRCARWRVHDAGERAKAAGIPRPPARTLAAGRNIDQQALFPG